MSLRDVLKWMFVLICTATTIQIFILAFIMGPLLDDHLRTFSRWELAMRLIYSLAAVLPLLIFVQRKPATTPAELMSWAKWRVPLNFLLTLVVLSQISNAWNWPLVSWLPITLITYGSATLTIARYGLRKRVIEQEKKEQYALQIYTEELEKQHASIRKFQHDYQNILLSMRGYFEEGDFPGLKEYFYSKIEAESEVITKNHFALRHLDKIKAREIKSLLATKLSLAQRIPAEVSFEANETIDDFRIDSVKLVRMLGILLDNAIEALAEIENGNLFVGCFRWKAGIYFIIQNTSPPDMPPFHAIWEPGFSTKGKGRGQGLSNLLECVASLPAVMLQTNITDGNFVQKLTITLDGSNT